MELQNQRADVHMHKINQTYYYNHNRMLTLSGTFPQVHIKNNAPAQASINRYIQNQVKKFYRYACSDLYHQAIEDYRDAIKNNFPFHPFEAVLQYEITYNEACYLSMYYDQYQFTGGAHGNTTRASNTFSLSSGEVVPLSSFFEPEQDYRALLLGNAIKQANTAASKQEGIYFENYPALMTENFHEDQYFLSPDGISIYYQQYDIAPYSTGIVVFTIPYKELSNVLRDHMPPHCQ